MGEGDVFKSIFKRSVTRRRQSTLTELRWHLPLPTDGTSARQTSEAICAQALPALERPPAAEWAAAHSAALEWAVRQRADVTEAAYLSLTTGVRLHYLRWGNLGDRRRLLLLHDLGDTAGVLGGLGSSIAARGFCVFACDMRGHGDSTRSIDAQYDCGALSEDLLSFVTELDLYQTPLAIAGFGLGARVAAHFASAYPRLVGSIALCELWLEPPADASFHPAQAARFADDMQAAACLSSNVWGHPPRNLATVARHNTMRLRPRRAGEHFTSMKLDPRWFSVPDAQALRTQAASLRCPTALVFGRRSHMGAGGWGGSKEPAAAAEHLRSLFPDASLTTLHPLSAGHFLLEEAPLELRDVLLERLSAWTRAGALDCGDSERKPETLGLRVLGPPPPPRARPSAAAIDRMLQED